MFLVQLYDCIKWTFQAQWVPEPPVDPATLDQTFGLKDATCRPNLMRMQSKDKPPSSIGKISSYLQLPLKEFFKCYLILNSYPGKKKLMVENGRDQPLNGVSIYILRRWSTEFKSLKTNKIYHNQNKSILPESKANLYGASIYILRRWLIAQMLKWKIISQTKINPHC